MTGLDSIALEHTKNNIASYGRFLFGRIQTSKDGDQPYSDTSLYDKRSMFEPSWVKNIKRCKNKIISHLIKLKNFKTSNN